MASLAAPGRRSGTRSTPTRPWLLRLAIVCAVIVVIVLSAGFAVFESGRVMGTEISWVIGHVVAAVCAGFIWWLSPAPMPGWVIVSYCVAETAYTWAIGIQAGWAWPLFIWVSFLPGAALVWLALAFPAGRLRRGFDRGLVTTAVTYLAVYATIDLLIGSTHPGSTSQPSSYAVFSNPALAAVLSQVHAAIMAMFAVVVAVVVIMRWARSTGAARQVAFIMPVAFLIWLAFGILWSLAQLGGWPPTARLVVENVNVLSVAFVPIAYATGLVRMRAIRARAVDLVQTGEAPTATGHDRWNGSVRTVLGDRTAALVWPGSQRTSSADARGRALSTVGDPESPLVYIDHDAALLDNPLLLRSVSASLRIMIENERLTAELRQSLREVNRSRLRIVRAADEARRRAERDLHDGSQQQLFSVALRLRMASDQARASGQDELADNLEVTIDQLASAIKELRELARGLHPALLSEGGLSPALAELGRRCTVPTKVTVDVRERPKPIVESTVYYVVSECLANVAKYSLASSCAVVVREEADDRLVVTVSDDGAGGADPTGGSGLRGLADRVDAVGGIMSVRSPMGEGTVIEVDLPLR